MIPDWSERSSEGAAYPNRHFWSAVRSEQQYCEICEKPLTDDEVECNDQFCDECLGKENLEDDE
ncbi:hypothetical protein [Pelosinus sp. sgz500959]|uniref:hypothetical protein n=1 Tax=Pelosinus sp. sgz500959 TaxID=3242472 RepID=UPI00366BDE8C